MLSFPVEVCQYLGPFPVEDLGSLNLKYNIKPKLWLSTSLKRSLLICSMVLAEFQSLNSSILPEKTLSMVSKPTASL